MKRLFMCVNYPLNNPSIGLSKKIKMQIEAFESLGYDVFYSAYIENGVAIFHKNEILLKQNYKSQTLNNLLRRFQLMHLCKRFIKTQRFKLGFLRWDAVDKTFLDIVKLLDKNCDKVLMDCHGYFKGYNIPGLKGYYTKYMTILNSNKLSKYIDFCLTESKNNQVFNIPAMCIDTGITIDNYKLHQYMGDKNELNMISVATETIYHGYDRIIQGLYEFKKNHKEKVYLHFVGKVSDKTKKLIYQLNLENYIFLYGYQNGKNLEKIYTMCNIGIGPLAPHRVGGKEGTGIKTKEYFAIGLPYFFAGQELLVPENYQYIMKIESSDSPIDIQKIFEFYNTIKNDSNMQKNMRDFARKHYSWTTILKTALMNL